MGRPRKKSLWSHAFILKNGEDGTRTAGRKFKSKGKLRETNAVLKLSRLAKHAL